jgi:hypothetical protein
LHRLHEKGTLPPFTKVRSIHMRKVLEGIGVTAFMITALLLGNAMRNDAIAGDPAKCVEAEDRCWYDCDTALPGGPGTTDWCYVGSQKWEHGNQT